MFSLDLNTFLFFLESSTSDREINLRMLIWSCVGQEITPYTPTDIQQFFLRS